MHDQQSWNTHTHTTVLSHQRIQPHLSNTNTKPKPKPTPQVVFKNAMATSATANFRELLRVVRVIKKMLLTTVAEATPASEEAQRALGFFVNR